MEKLIPIGNKWYNIESLTYPASRMRTSFSFQLAKKLALK